jgi:hypothetical protein
MRSLLVSACAFVCLLAVAAGCGSDTSSPTPTHVVAVWVDGLNHADARQVCTAVRIPAHSTRAECETYYANLIGRLAFYGLFGSYRVVGHSVEQWREGSVKVARVTVYSVSDKTNLLHVRLVKTAHGWRIASVS